MVPRYHFRLTQMDYTLKYVTRRSDRLLRPARVRGKTKNETSGQKNDIGKSVSGAQIEHGELAYFMRPSRLCVDCKKRFPNEEESERLFLYREQFGQTWVGDNFRTSKSYCVCLGGINEPAYYGRFSQWLRKHLKVVVVLIKLYPKFLSKGNQKDKREARYLLKLIKDHLSGKPLDNTDRKRLSRFKKRANEILYALELPESDLCLSRALDNFKARYEYDPIYWRGRMIVSRRSSEIAGWVRIYSDDPNEVRIGMLYLRSAVNALFDAFEYPEYDPAEDAVPED